MTAGACLEVEEALLTGTDAAKRKSPRVKGQETYITWGWGWVGAERVKTYYNISVFVIS